MAGFTLIRHKRGEAGTYPRTAAQLAAIAGAAGERFHLAHFIPPDLDRALIAGTNTQGLTTYFERALEALPARGGELVLPQSRLQLDSGIVIRKPGTRIVGQGAVVEARHSTLTPLINILADDVALLGGEYAIPSGRPYFLSITGKRSLLDGVSVRKGTEVTGTVAIFWRYGADGAVMRNCRLVSTHGTQVECNDFQAVGNTLICPTPGGDDAFAIKAIQGPTTNHRYLGNTVEGHAAIVSIGTQVGTANANDPRYSKYVRGIVVTGNTGKRCGGIGLIKPGTLDDYRDGLIEDVEYSNNTLSDPNGEKLDKGFTIHAARGMVVRNVRGRGNLVTGRHLGTRGRARIGALWLFQQDLGGTRPPRFEDIDLEIEFRDPHGGVPNSRMAPGYPADGFVLIEKSPPTHGTMSGIKVRVAGNGCSRNGLEIGAGLDDAVTVEKLTLRNANREGSGAGFGGIVGSRVKVIDADIALHSAGLPWGVFGAGSLVGERLTGSLGTALPAGRGGSRDVLTLPQRAMIAGIGLVSPNAVARSDADYWRLAFRKVRGGRAGAEFAAASTARGGSAVAANALSPLVGFVPGELFEAGDTLRVEKTDHGAGKPLAGRIEVNAVPW